MKNLFVVFQIVSWILLSLITLVSCYGCMEGLPKPAWFNYLGYAFMLSVSIALIALWKNEQLKRLK